MSEASETGELVCCKVGKTMRRLDSHSPTSTILKLNYYHLQRRLHPTLPAREGPPRPPTFVTLPIPPFSSAGAGAEGGTLELVRPGGGRVTLRWPGATAPDWLSLVHEFLRA